LSNTNNSSFPLIGARENRKQKMALISILEKILPCEEQYAIAVLSLKTGHAKRYIREEVIETLKDAKLIVSDGVNLRSINGKKIIEALDELVNDGELPTDEYGNHIKEEEDEETENN
jgi:hypothetical protein